MSAPYQGYPGQVWACVYLTMQWLATQLASGTAPVASLVSPISVALQTVRNADTAVDIWEAGQALSAETVPLAELSSLPLSLDPDQQAYFSARVAAVSAAASGLVGLPPPVSPIAVAGLLAAGSPGVPRVDYVGWCSGFAAETPPSGLTSGTISTDLASYAAGEAAAWTAITQQTFGVQGTNLTQAYDAATRMTQVSSLTAQTIASFTGGPFAATDPTQVWNQVVALPTILLDAGVINAAPFTFVNQTAGVVRYAVHTLALQLAVTLLAMRQPTVQNPAQATLRLNDTLMDMAARTTGNIDPWATIAALNGILPPYPGPANNGFAGSGLLLPGTGPLPTPGVMLPTYLANVLGIDYDFGPINPTIDTTPMWTGDILLIGGYGNFARAIGRRLQTPIGTLIYHTTYGSRIPPEVGAVQTADEAARLKAYGDSAIVSDPRTGSILSSQATVQPGFLATYQALVQPIGPGATPQSVNETIAPLP